MAEQPRLGFVKIVVDDLVAAERFYAEAFGMVRTGAFATNAIEEVILQGAGGGMSLVLFHWLDRRPLVVGSAHGPIGFYVDDVDASFARAVAAGGSPLREPAQYGETIRAAFVADPESHEIELIRRG